MIQKPGSQFFFFFKSLIVTCQQPTQRDFVTKAWFSLLLLSHLIDPAAALPQTDLQQKPRSHFFFFFKSRHHDSASGPT